MNENVTGLSQPQRQQDSVMQQLEHLGHELSALDEAFQSLNCKAQPILTPSKPVCTGNDTAKEIETADRSAMMQQAVELTTKTRAIKGYVIRITDELQI